MRSLGGSLLNSWHFPGGQIREYKKCAAPFFYVKVICFENALTTLSPLSYIPSSHLLRLSLSASISQNEIKSWASNFHVWPLTGITGLQERRRMLLPSGTQDSLKNSSLEACWGIRLREWACPSCASVFVRFLLCGRVLLADERDYLKHTFFVQSSGKMTHLCPHNLNVFLFLSVSQRMKSKSWRTEAGVQTQTETPRPWHNFYF